MKKLLFVLLLTGCAGTPYIEVGAGQNTSFFGHNKWDNGGSIGATLEVGKEWQWDDRTFTKCRWTHTSQWFVGPPFNNTPESSLDHIGCSLRKNF